MQFVSDTATVLGIPLASSQDSHIFVAELDAGQTLPRCH